MKILLHILITMALFACPFNCMGTGLDETGSVQNDVSKHCCNCCSHGNSASQKNRSPEQQDDCPCSNCLCQGAVTGIENIDFEVSLFDCFLTDVPLISETTQQVLSLHLSCDAPARLVETGSSTRILHQSLLI